MILTSECDAIAEVVIEVAPVAACGVGLYVLQPQSCTPMLWLQANPAFKELIKLGFAKGCEFVVDVGERDTRIEVRDARRSYRKAVRTYHALNTPSGVQWLMNRLAGVH